MNFGPLKASNLAKHAKDSIMQTYRKAHNITTASKTGTNHKLWGF